MVGKSDRSSGHCVLLRNGDGIPDGNVPSLAAKAHQWDILCAPDPPLTPVRELPIAWPQSARAAREFSVKSDAVQIALPGYAQQHIHQQLPRRTSPRHRAAATMQDPRWRPFKHRP